MTIYDFEVIDIHGELISLREFEGKVILIVNTATKCQHARQLEELEELYQKYKDQGFIVLGFPCNQFLGKEPYDGEVLWVYCRLTYHVTFPLFEKIDVKGENADPLFQYLTQQETGLFGSDIKFNFTKFLIGRDGNVVKRYSPFVSKDHLQKDITKELLKNKIIKKVSRDF